MTRDSIDYIHHEDPQTLNLYAYCWNDPVNSVDPEGHDVQPGPNYEEKDTVDYLLEGFNNDINIILDYNGPDPIGCAAAAVKGIKLLKAANKAESLKYARKLPSIIGQNVKRFFEKASSKYTDFLVRRINKGTYFAQMVKPVLAVNKNTAFSANKNTALDHH